MKYLQQLICLCCLLLSGFETLSAEKIYVEETHFPRKALVRNDCVINTLVSEVEVGGNKDFNNIMDTDLDNYGTIVGVASVGTLVKPMLLVKDTKHYYKAGTKAGFCLQADAGSGLLELDVLRSVSIFFYRDGKLVGQSIVDQGNDTGLLNLGLIQIPGADAGVTFLTATAPDEVGYFDEIGLVDNGITVGAVRTYEIRYAFVGDVIETALTEKNFKDIELELGWNAHNIVDPEHIIDPDTTNKAVQPKILVDLGAKFTLGGASTYFKKNTEVGFVFEDKGLLDLSIGGVSSITIKNDKLDMSETIMLRSQVLGLGLINGKKTKVSIVAPFEFNRVTLDIEGVSVSLSGREFYYGFVSEPTEVPHSNDLHTTMDSYIGMEVTQYEMFSDKSAKWEIVKHPDSETSLQIQPAPDGKSAVLTGMTPNVVGEYHILVKSEECPCENTIVLKRGNLPALDPACKKPISGDHIILSDKMHESSGSLISISDVSYPERIIDDDMDTYAEYTGGLSIAQNLQIVGVKSKDGSLLHDGKNPKKIGFVLEVAGELLDAQVLEFFQIRLYKDGKKVHQEVIKNTQVVSAGLIGGEQSAKTRFGIESPVGVPFDEITIWKSGVLSLGLSKIRIYGAYITDVSLKCYEDPLACGSTIMDTENYGTYINYNHTGFSGVSIGTIQGLENVIDDDKETAALITGVSVGAWEVSIYLGRTMDRTHQACVIMDEKTYLASLKLVGTLKFSLYREGVFITDVDNWGVLGLDAIGNGDKMYLFITPTATYDEIRITSGQLAEVETTHIYGVAVRDDMNQNGIPDCLEDPLVLNVSGVRDLCVGEQLFLTGATEPNLKYTVEIGELGIQKEFDTGTTGEFLWDLGAAEQPVKDALIKVSSSETNAPKAPLLFVTVHPNRTKWVPETEPPTGVILRPTHWNTWDNWDRGTPWSCTDVIIPAQAEYYPELLPDEVNACRYIHFEPGGEVVHTHRLRYEKAWVELAMKPNRYYMVTVPLKEMRSGDWFFPAAKGSEPLYPDTFAVLNETTVPANRMTPTIYQRLWESDAADRLMTGKWGPVYPVTSRWTKPFNLLAANYDPADGFALSVWVHPSTATNNEEGDPERSYIFRFPKEHAKYFYVNDKGTTLDLSEVMRRDMASVGRFITEQADSTVSFPVKLWVKNQYQNATHTFLAPNPFMSHLDIEKFLQGNPDLSYVQVYDGTGNNALIQVTEGAGGLLSSKGDAPAYKKIAPLQSFFVTAKNDVTACELVFTEEMLCAGTGAGNLLKSAAANERESMEDAIYLQAESGGFSAHSMIYFNASASDTYKVGEDAEVLIDQEASPAMELFTIAGERALDIQQRAHGGVIPLGFYAAKPMDDVCLTITLPMDYSGWVLEDLELGKLYPLQAGTDNQIQVGRLTAQAGRFLLKGSGATANEPIVATPAKLYAYVEAGSDQLVICSREGWMQRCEVYAVDGKLRGIARFGSDEYRMRRTRGVNIIKVYFEDGRSEIVKLLGN